jgi:hypothetical protein
MTQAGLYWGAGTSMAVAVFAGFAEWRRGKRRDLDRVGIMPWNGIQVFAFLLAVIAAVLAVKR